MYNLEAIVLYGKQPCNDSRAEFIAEWEKKTPCFSAISGEISYFPLQQYCFVLFIGNTTVHLCNPTGNFSPLQFWR